MNRSLRSSVPYGPGDAGFTLIELMVVLLILAILLAVAIPTFLGATRSANGRVAQSNLHTALLESQNTYYTSGQAYLSTAAMISALQGTEKNFTFQTAPSTNHSQVSVYVSTDRNSMILALQSSTKKDCWYTILNAQTEAATRGTPYFTLPAFAIVQGTFYGEAKLPANGVPRTCQASTVFAASPGSVAYQKGSFPTL